MMNRLKVGACTRLVDSYVEILNNLGDNFHFQARLIWWFFDVATFSGETATFPGRTTIFPGQTATFLSLFYFPV